MSTTAPVLTQFLTLDVRFRPGTRRLPERWRVTRPGARRGQCYRQNYAIPAETNATLAAVQFLAHSRTPGTLVSVQRLDTTHYRVTFRADR